MGKQLSLFLLGTFLLLSSGAVAGEKCGHGYKDLPQSDSQLWISGWGEYWINVEEITFDGRLYRAPVMSFARQGTLRTGTAIARDKRFKRIVRVEYAEANPVGRLSSQEYDEKTIFQFFSSDRAFCWTVAMEFRGTREFLFSHDAGHHKDDVVKDISTFLAGSFATQMYKKAPIRGRISVSGTF